MKDLKEITCEPLERWFSRQDVSLAISSGPHNSPRRPDETPVNTPHNPQLDPEVVPDSEQSATPGNSPRARSPQRSEEMVVDTAEDFEDNDHASSDDQPILVPFFSPFLKRREVNPDQRVSRAPVARIGGRARGKGRNDNVDPQE
jgi:hypothetical protein